MLDDLVAKVREVDRLIVDLEEGIRRKEGWIKETRAEIIENKIQLKELKKKQTSLVRKVHLQHEAANSS